MSIIRTHFYSRDPTGRRFRIGGPSFLCPRATIFSASSGSGRCNFNASPTGAVIQSAISSSVVRMTGMAFGWIGPTTASGSVVKTRICRW